MGETGKVAQGSYIDAGVVGAVPVVAVGVSHLEGLCHKVEGRVGVTSLSI